MILQICLAPEAVIVHPERANGPILRTMLPSRLPWIIQAVRRNPSVLGFPQDASHLGVISNSFWYSLCLPLSPFVPPLPQTMPCQELPTSTVAWLNLTLMHLVPYSGQNLSQNHCLSYLESVLSEHIPSLMPHFSDELPPPHPAFFICLICLLCTLNPSLEDMT